ncbi:TRAP transporter small permease [Ammoniphilus sp. 3BR4]|uniref:TRAP transporter small permease n=1 Tax=Ammoniphilus sp. 3BR4 TaxID=3158265 RepID=UPI0034676C20
MKKIEKLLEIITVTLMALLVIVVSAQVISRMFNSPFMWTEEFSRFALVYLTFLGAALAYYKGEGLRITMFIDRFPPAVRKANDAVMLVMSVILSVCLVIFSFDLAKELWGTPSTALQWDRGIVVLVIPVGFALIFLKLIRDVKKTILTR